LERIFSCAATDISSFISSKNSHAAAFPRPPSLKLHCEKSCCAGEAVFDCFAQRPLFKAVSPILQFEIGVIPFWNFSCQN
jgi:hypothetical protein